MKSLSKLILTAIIICGTATTALAGMEPFYKGEWGMTPDEVKALYDVPSIMVEKSEDGNYYFKEYAIPYYVSGNKPNNFLLYEFTAADKTGYAFYSFTNSEIPENLTLQYVYCGFIVDESFWRNREVIIKEIATLITANTDDFDYFSTPWVEDRTIQQAVMGGGFNNDTIVSIFGNSLKTSGNKTFTIMFGPATNEDMQTSLKISLEWPQKQRQKLTETDE